MLATCRPLPQHLLHPRLLLLLPRLRLRLLLLLLQQQMMDQAQAQMLLLVPLLALVQAAGGCQLPARQVLPRLLLLLLQLLLLHP
jgi:hypothetical protein